MNVLFSFRLEILGVLFDSRSASYGLFWVICAAISVSLIKEFLLQFSITEFLKKIFHKGKDVANKCSTNTIVYGDQINIFICLQEKTKRKRKNQKRAK